MQQLGMVTRATRSDGSGIQRTASVMVEMFIPLAVLVLTSLVAWGRGTQAAALVRASNP